MKKIIAIQLHDVMFVAGKEIKRLVDAKTYPGIKMEYNHDESAVEIELNGATFDIPTTNCKNVVYTRVQDLKVA